MGILNDLVEKIIGRAEKPEKYKNVPTVSDYARMFLERKFLGSSSTPMPTAAPSPTPIQPTPTPMGQIPGFRTWNPPPQLSGLTIQSAQKENLHPAILAALLQTESGFNPKAYNRSMSESGVPSEDIGIGQFNTVAYPNITRKQAEDPNFAIPYAANIIAKNLKQRQDLAQAIASYNVGGRVGLGAGRDERGLGPKGRAYLNKIVKNIDPSVLEQLGLLPQY